MTFDNKYYKDLAEQAIESGKTFETNHPDRANAMFTRAIMYQNKVIISLLEEVANDLKTLEMLQ